jgi:hypothetical protein
MGAAMDPSLRPAFHRQPLLLGWPQNIRFEFVDLFLFCVPHLDWIF